MNQAYQVYLNILVFICYIVWSLLSIRFFSHFYFWYGEISPNGFQLNQNQSAAYITLKNTRFRCILGKDLFRLGGGLRGTKQFPQMPEMQGRGPRTSIGFRQPGGNNQLQSLGMH